MSSREKLKKANQTKKTTFDARRPWSISKTSLVQTKLVSLMGSLKVCALSSVRTKGRLKKREKTFK